LKIVRIPAGIYAANCYIIYSEVTRDAIVVDPGGDVDDILSSIRENGLKIKYTIKAMGTVEIEPDILLKDGDIIEFGDEKAQVIHTPGHTRGGICIKIGDSMITGDTLFTGSIGRTDLLGGDYDSIINSIKDKIMIYSDDIKVFPGHGAPSTIGRERTSNPFLR